VRTGLYVIVLACSECDKSRFCRKLTQCFLITELFPTLRSH